MTEKPSLSFWQIWNMSFGFLGIQFGWSLQMANMSPIYKSLGADADKIPILWLAAPMTGLLVQPVIGYWSDRTWTPLGRRRPYFLVGAILASLALFLMPQSSTLWMAAGLLWVLDASINISMEPFRAFVVDMLPEKQHSRGFTFQSFMIGVGAVIASALPWIMTNWLHISEGKEDRITPSLVYSFYTGAIVLLIAVLYTVFTTKPYPPADMEEFKKFQQKASLKDMFREIFGSVTHMPKVMRQVALVQFFTWAGLFLMFFYYSSAVAEVIFHGRPEIEGIRASPAYDKGVEFAGLTLSFYNLITFLTAFIIGRLATKVGNQRTHFLCLLLGAAGLISLRWIEEPNMLFLSMAGVGVAWASILSMPYAMFAGSLPKEKIGMYMGIFNLFIVIPEIIAAVGFGWFMKNVLGNDMIDALSLGGALMVVAAIFSLRVGEKA